METPKTKAASDKFASAINRSNFILTSEKKNKILEIFSENEGLENIYKKLIESKILVGTEEKTIRKTLEELKFFCYI